MRAIAIGLLALVAVGCVTPAAAQAPSQSPGTPPRALVPDTAPPTQIPPPKPAGEVKSLPPNPNPREWAPGPLLGPDGAEPVGRFHAKNALMSFTLPESWRSKDVVVRELVGGDAQKVQPGVDAAVVIEYVPEKAKPRPLVSIFRLPLAAWRKLEDSKTTFGRLTMNTQQTAYSVVRPEDAQGQDRYAELRGDLEDLLITLAIYDPEMAAAALRRPVAEHYAGALPNGEPLQIDFNRDGTMALRHGKAGKEVKGQWMQRNNQVIMLPLLGEGKAAKSILLHFDNHTLVVVTWDEKMFGPVGARLDAGQ